MSLCSNSYSDGQEAPPRAAWRLMLSGTGQAEGRESGPVHGAVDPGVTGRAEDSCLLMPYCLNGPPLPSHALFPGGGGRGVGRSQEPELGGAAAGLFAFAEAALDSKVWGPLVTASWFFHEWGRAKKHLDPAPTTTLPRFP